MQVHAAPIDHLAYLVAYFHGFASLSQRGLFNIVPGRPLVPFSDRRRVATTCRHSFEPGEPGPVVYRWRLTDL